MLDSTQQWSRWISCHGFVRCVPQGRRGFRVDKILQIILRLDVKNFGGRTSDYCERVEPWKGRNCSRCGGASFNDRSRPQVHDGSCLGYG